MIFKKKFYALGVEQRTLIFFPWNNNLKCFSAGSTLEVNGSITPWLNKNRNPLHLPKQKQAELIDAQTWLNDHANTWLNKYFAEL